MAARRQHLDTAIQVVTPENIAFEHRIAGPFRRLPAYIIDYLIRTAILIGFCFLAFFVFLFLGVSTSNFDLIGGMLGMSGLLLLFVLMFAYGGLFETFWNGQTPGKWMTGLRVVSVDGTPINAMQAMLRNVLRFVDSFPALPAFMLFEDGTLLLWTTYQVGLFAMMLTPRYQRLGDIVCGTLVVVEQRYGNYGVVRVDEPEVVRLAAELPPDLEVTRSLGQALSAYVGRRRYFPPGRRADIARHVGEPLRKRFRLPEGTSHDLILCAVYYRTFIADQGAIDAPPQAVAVDSPFQIQTAAAPWTPPPQQQPLVESMPIINTGSSDREMWTR